MDAHRLRPLVEAFVWPLIFFNTCDDNTLDPDVAVQQMEQIGAILQPLDPELKALVMHIIHEIAQDETQPDVRACLQELPDGLGWLAGDEPLETP
ncbi:hypothetical protein [Deinococcus sp. QL22]|uniref:hypothetical protein n=1 Tax=Deinococcus sp. QL22 TaxID=2939437 RepID=UPI0020170673|nr:hypothetical protein [Deinococcus sp. QL22]UQN10711.1 hypothetical protein M1R55_30535 [Deinococcus sp. QL22]